jgi:UDP-N-acetyl-L-fucosamine synthase
MLAGLEIDRFHEGLSILKLQNANPCTMQPVRDYQIPNVCEKVARILLSYTNYINRYVGHNLE